MKTVRILALAAALFAVAACGAQPSEPAEAAASEPAEAITVDVRLTTSSGTIGANHDGEFCVWRQPSYVLRDGGGNILATGDAKSLIPGEAEAQGEAAEIGKVRSMDPEYECTLDFAIYEAKVADFYELEVTTVDPRLGDREFVETATFSRSDTEGESITVEFAG